MPSIGPFFDVFQIHGTVVGNYRKGDDASWKGGGPDGWTEGAIIKANV